MMVATMFVSGNDARGRTFRRGREGIITANESPSAGPKGETTVSPKSSARLLVASLLGGRRSVVYLLCVSPV